MTRFTLTLGAISLFAAFNNAVAQTVINPYGQCGGSGWNGGTICTSGWACVYINPFFSTCQVATTGSADGPLIPGYTWIRTVDVPDIRKYLHSSNQNAPGQALMGITTTASQFVVEAGQLKHYLPGGGFLYAIVGELADSDGQKLRVSFSTTPATKGTFAWSGDKLTWSLPTITRHDAGAWVTCNEYVGRTLYVNLAGPYTWPGGCYKHALYSYTESVPNS